MPMTFAGLLFFELLSVPRYMLVLSTLAAASIIQVSHAVRARNITCTCTVCTVCVGTEKHEERETATG